MLASGLLALVLTAVLSPVAIAFLRRAGIYDVPNERSSHSSTVPRGVGMAALVAIVTVGAMSGSLVGRDKVALLLAVVAFGAIGFMDDLINLRPLVRLALQPVAAVAVLPWLMQGLGAHWLIKPVLGGAVVLGLVAYVNAYNFMDGIDGIAAAQALVAGGSWCIVGLIENEEGLATGGAILAGAALGFGLFNFPRAIGFLGDVGSYAFGAGLAVVAVVGLRAGVPPEAVLAPLGIALADTGWTLARRVAVGEPWYLPHRTHVYQRLTDLGWSHVRTTGAVTGWLVACSLMGGLSLSGSPPARVAGDLALVLLLFGYLAAPRWLRGRHQGSPAAGT